MREPETVAKLVLYEHPIENWVTRDVVQRLERLGQRDDWDGLVEAFMRHLEVPQQEIDEIKTTPFWSVWIVDAPSTLNDLRALVALCFNAEEYRVLTMPVALMIGSESPRRNYVTDALAAALPNAEILTLEGTAHEGMTMVPEQFVEKVSHFLLG
jgi:pimeloyl-ACP methyl ester carboxylesterase